MNSTGKTDQLNNSISKQETVGKLTPWLPLVSTLILAAVTIPYLLVNPEKTGKTWPEIASYWIGHELNSLWVAGGLGLIIISSLFAIKRGGGMWLWRVFDALVLNFLLVDGIFKQMVFLHRPGRPEHAGFPSGHATGAFLLAFLVWRKYPKLGPIWFAVAVVIAWSRVISYAHFPYQVIAGALLGCAIGAAVTSIRGGILLPRLVSWIWRRPAVDESSP